jgi:hypothetical protein
MEKEKTKLETWLDENQDEIYIDSETKEKFLWKPTAAKVLERSERTLQRRKDLKSIEIDRKIYYSTQSLLELEAELNKPVIHPQIDENNPNGHERTDIALPLSEWKPEKLLQVTFGVLQQLNEKLDARPSATGLTQLTGKLNVDIEELCEATNFAKSELLKVIHEAEHAGELNRYKGKNRKAVWNCAELDRILPRIQPAAVTKPPMRKKE